jgi:sugar lactone lactonase YvrE
MSKTAEMAEPNQKAHPHTTPTTGISPQGKHLGTVLLGVTSNCAWGDDGSALYITATDRVCRIQTNTRGASFRS